MRGQPRPQRTVAGDLGRERRVLDRNRRVLVRDSRVLEGELTEEPRHHLLRRLHRRLPNRPVAA